MSIADQIDQDLKQAMLGGDKVRAGVLRMLKNSLQYEAVNLGVKDAGLSDEQVQKVLSKEVKNRVESAKIYKNAGENERAKAEETERLVLEKYLPVQADEAEISRAVKEEIAKFDSPKQSDMGKIIGAVRAKFGASADGGLIARLVKEAIEE